MTEASEGSVHESRRLATAPRVASLAEVSIVAEILTSAFLDDPVHRWWMRDDQRYEASLRALLEFLTKEDIPGGLVFFVGDGSAAAIWQPPVKATQPFPLWQQLLAAPGVARLTGVRRLPRFFQLMSLMQAHQPKEPHFHLFYLGVAAKSQGHGIGSTLLQKTLETVDAAGLPAYLENSNPRNRPLYERSGFRLVAEGALGRGGPTMQFMWRPARPRAA